MKLKCKKATAFYPLTVGKTYDIEDYKGELYKIYTDIGSTVWIKMSSRDYEFEPVVRTKKLKKEYD